MILSLSVLIWLFHHVDCAVSPASDIVETALHRQVVISLVFSLCYSCHCHKCSLYREGLVEGYSLMVLFNDKGEAAGTGTGRVVY